MRDVGRNDPCPCGSGKKFKKCCGAQRQSPLAGLTAGIRMKGGVGFDEESNGYVAIVHSWQNANCEGEPTEWHSLQVFSTEEEAMRHYKSYIWPELHRMMSKLENDLSDGSLIHRELE